MALLFSRIPLAGSIAFAVLIWGIVCILTTVCSNYSGFVAQRFILGLTESAVSPAFVAVTALWYKPYEQTKRLGTSTFVLSQFMLKAYIFTTFLAFLRYLVFCDRCRLYSKYTENQVTGADLFYGVGDHQLWVRSYQQATCVAISVGSFFLLSCRQRFKLEFT